MTLDTTEMSPDIQSYIEFIKLLKAHKPVKKKVDEYLTNHSFHIRKMPEFYPLRVPSLQVPESWFKTTHLEYLETKMIEAMQQANGIGLAAIQIGIPLDIFCIQSDEGPVFFYNPIIHSESDAYNASEGCLSLEGQHGVIRYKQIFMSHTNHDGISEASVFTGLVAEIIQHEMDHLKGVMLA